MCSKSLYCTDIDKMWNISKGPQSNSTENNWWTLLHCFCQVVPKHTHTQPFNGPLFGTTQVSRYQKGKTNLDFAEARGTVSGSGIRWAICKSAPRSIQITMPVPHHSVFYRPDALPAAQPTASKHWRHWCQKVVNNVFFMWQFFGHISFTDFDHFWYNWRESVSQCIHHWKNFRVLQAPKWKKW